jgi:hypothetical protein
VEQEELILVVVVEEVLKIHQLVVLVALELLL